VTFPAGRGLTGAIEVLCLGSRDVVIPMAALPLVGRGLSPSLFELSALARAERDGRLPLTLRFLTRLHAPPGVTVARTGPGTAEGYLTAAGARELGAALTRQLVADHTHGSYGTDGLFAGGLSLALPGTPSAPVTVRPDFPMHTVTVTATTMNGKPDTGDVVYMLNVKQRGRDLAQDTLTWFGQPVPPRLVRDVLLAEEHKFATLLLRGRPLLSRLYPQGQLTEDDYRFLHETHGLPHEVVAEIIAER
jgi:hypothetical protein